MTDTQVRPIDAIDKLLNPELLDLDRKYLGYYKQIWNNGGCLDSGTRLGMRAVLRADYTHTDLMRDMFSSDHPTLTERVLSGIVYEAIDSGTYIQSYLPTVKLNRDGRIVILPAWGDIEAGEMAEGSEYPGRELEKEDQVQARIGKAGCGFGVSDLALRHDDFDVVKRHTQALSRALARHKEKKVYNLLRDKGTVVFDNLNSAVRSTTGYNASGAKNGTVTVNDIADVQDTLLNNGYLPDTIILHPRAWMMFLEKRMALAFGIVKDNSWAAQALPERNGTDPSRVANTFTGFPSSWNIVVSTAVKYTPERYSATGVGPKNALTDVLICDSKAAGLIIDTGNGVRVNTWRDPNRELTRVGASENYGVAILDNGLAVGVLKDVSIAPSIDFTSTLATTIAESSLGLSGDRYESGLYTGNY